ncbi:uncharacterized protein LOC144104714 [Amblyomma americanum]
MSPRGQQYTLIGFAADLDWRPLRFVKPIPQNRICRACGVVCMKTALFPCMHLLCQSCYDHCAEDRDRVCPLDGQHFQDADVIWAEWPPGEILKREAACWNRESGCDAVMAASEIPRHFQGECRHHSVPCRWCSATLLRSDVCSHLRSRCRALLTNPDSQRPGQSSCTGDQTLSGFRQVLKEHVCEMRAFLERMSANSASSDAVLNEICHSMNASNEALKQELTYGLNALKESLEELAAATRQNQANLATSLREVVASNQQMKKCLLGQKDRNDNHLNIVTTLVSTMKNELINAMKANAESLVDMAAAASKSTSDAKEKGRKALVITERELRLTMIRVDNCAFFVKGVRSRIDTAAKIGYSYYDHERVYLCGYCMLPGVKFQKEGHSITLHIAFSMCKGYLDDSVTWPFGDKIKLSVTHPKKDAACEIIVNPRPRPELARPTKSVNPGIWYRDDSLKLQELIRDGYVHNDQLRIKWQLLL